MIGLVLCGGQSIRMGRDKGLIRLDQKIWAESMREKLDTLSFPSVLSINSLQKENYLQYFDERELVVDNPDLNIEGPLLGLLSTHLSFPSHDLLVLACDMVLMNSIVLRKLYDDYKILKPLAIAFKSDHVEPTCAIYSSRGLEQILHSHRHTSLSKNSLTHILDQLQAVYISIPDDWKLYFKNLNSDEDLN